MSADSKVFTAEKKIEDKTPEPQKEEVAKKTMYFRHDGTGEPVIVKKGESLSFLDKDIFDPITKEQYLDLQTKPAEEEESAPFAPVEEPPVEEEPEEPQEEPESNISLDVVTTKTREFIQSNPAHRAKLKAFLDKKGAKKVTDLPPSTYYEFLDFIGAAD